MLRPIILKQDTSFQTLATDMLRTRLSKAQSDAALDKLKVANPHVEKDKIAAGTVVLVPDAPGFKSAGTTSLLSEPFDDFGALATAALGAAAERVKAGAVARDRDRAELAAALKSAAFKRATANDPEVVRQAEAALKAAEQDAAADKAAAEAFAGIEEGVKEVLAALRKVVG